MAIFILLLLFCSGLDVMKGEETEERRHCENLFFMTKERWVVLQFYKQGREKKRPMENDVLSKGCRYPA